ncbi:dTDP-4-amino-4,6-dideoxyglucose formyltransferase [Flavobacterium tegetincola]|uniref:dTDP-4-amino-4,6-dideoxyglucose formyltransferase n=1 Tax=Flavobacterium tegetincola TaxID=150172 RepID=UPI00041D60D7|nr:dTDP-4-amino-4,6-dideoxyglucose formyltransferase [Flavobacterium tegetincola]
MYKNIIVISDNQFMMQSFAEIISKKQIDSINVSYAISPYSNYLDFNILTENRSEIINVLDLKNQDTVKQVIKEYDLIFSIHCKQLFPKELVDNVKCINVHPGYNPLNRGWYPQVFAIINDTNIGATIHEIDEFMDHGAIIARAFVEKKYSDTSLSLYNRIIEKEIELIDEHLLSIITNTYKTSAPESEGNLYLKKDFNKLTEIQLDERLSALEFINKLRALTHGTYKNAYFVNPENGKKVFLSINVEEENEDL